MHARFTSDIRRYEVPQTNSSSLTPAPRSPPERSGALGAPASDGERGSGETKSPGKYWSGRRGSNPRPTAWKAVTLPLSYSRLRAAPLRHCGASAGQARFYVVSPAGASAALRRGKPASMSSRPLRHRGASAGQAHLSPAGLLSTAARSWTLAPSASTARRWLAQPNLRAQRALSEGLACPAEAREASEGWWRGEDSNLRSR